MPTKSTINQLLKESDDALRLLEEAQIGVIDRGLRQALLDLQSQLRRDYNEATSDIRDSSNNEKRTARAKALIKQTEAIIDAFQLSGPGGFTDTLQAGLIAAQQRGIDDAETTLSAYGDSVPFQGTFDVRSVVGAVRNSGLRWSKHSDEFKQRAQEHIISGLIRGAPLAGVINHLAEETGIARSKAALIVRTETLAAHDYGRRRSYMESGIEYVQRLATMDTKVCPYCAARHGKIYKIEDAPSVIHGHDRCTNLPFRPEWADEGVIDLDSFDLERLKMIEKAGGVNLGIAPFERNQGFSPREYSKFELMNIVREYSEADGTDYGDDKRVRQKLRSAEQAMADGEWSRVAAILIGVESLNPSPRLRERAQGIEAQLNEQMLRPVVPVGTPGPAPAPQPLVVFEPISQTFESQEGFGEQNSPSKLTKAQRRALDLYVDDEGFEAINQYLRTGDPEAAEAIGIEEDQIQEHILKLSELTENGSLTEDILLYRGVNTTDWLGEIKVGDQVHDAGFVSTSTDFKTAKHMARGGLLFEIEAPKGTKGVSLIKYSESPEEFEVLLHRGTTFTITGLDLTAKPPRVRGRVDTLAPIQPEPILDSERERIPSKITTTSTLPENPASLMPGETQSEFQARMEAHGRVRIPYGKALDQLKIDFFGDQENNIEPTKTGEQITKSLSSGIMGNYDRLTMAEAQASEHLLEQVFQFDEAGHRKALEQLLITYGEARDQANKGVLSRSRIPLYDTRIALITRVLGTTGPVPAGLPVIVSRPDPLIPKPEPTIYKSYTDLDDDDLVKIAKERFTPLTNQTEVNAIELYSHQGDNVINERLRHGTRTYADANKVEFPVASENALIRYINKADLPENVLLYRGIQDSGLMDTLEVGAVFQDLGFASTTLVRQVAWELSMGDKGTQPAIMEIEAPKGLKVASVEAYTAHEFEFEMLMQKGTRFTLLEKSVDKNGVTVFRVRAENTAVPEVIDDEVSNAKGKEDTKANVTGKTSTIPVETGGSASGQEGFKAIQVPDLTTTIASTAEFPTFTANMLLEETEDEYFNRVMQEGQVRPAITKRIQEIVDDPDLTAQEVTDKFTASIIKSGHLLSQAELKAYELAIELVNASDSVGLHTARQQFRDAYLQSLETHQLIPSDDPLIAERLQIRAEIMNRALLQSVPGQSVKIPVEVIPITEVTSPGVTTIPPPGVSKIKNDSKVRQLLRTAEGTTDLNRIREIITQIDGFELTSALAARLIDLRQKPGVSLEVNQPPIPVKLPEIVPAAPPVIPVPSEVPTNLIQDDKKARQLIRAAESALVDGKASVVRNKLDELTRYQLSDSLSVRVQAIKAQIDKKVEPPHKPPVLPPPSVEVKRETPTSAPEPVTETAPKKIVSPDLVAEIGLLKRRLADQKITQIEYNKRILQLENLSSISDEDRRYIAEAKATPALFPGIPATAPGKSLLTKRIDMIINEVRQARMALTTAIGVLEGLKVNPMTDREKSRIEDLLADLKGARRATLKSEGPAELPEAKGNIKIPEPTEEERIDFTPKHADLLKTLQKRLDSNKFYHTIKQIDLTIDAGYLTKGEEQHLRRTQEVAAVEYKKQVDRRETAAQQARRVHPPGIEVRRQILADVARDVGVPFDKLEPSDKIGKHDIRSRPMIPATENVLQILEVSSRQTTSVKPEFAPGAKDKFNNYTKASIDEGIKAWRRLVPAGMIEDFPPPKMDLDPAKRSFYSQGNETAYLSKDLPLLTVLHELGHHLEHHTPGLLEKSRQFVARRTKGETFRKLRDITGNPGYRSDEVAKPDKFVNPYIGKESKENMGTELVTVGLEAMWNDPIYFASADPEHFDFIWDIITGRI
jgi:SPP1 gp7 family putative phage head morphogenesis protein